MILAFFALPATVATFVLEDFQENLDFLAAPLTLTVLVAPAVRDTLLALSLGAASAVLPGTATIGATIAITITNEAMDLNAFDLIFIPPVNIICTIRSLVHTK